MYIKPYNIYEETDTLTKQLHDARGGQVTSYIVYSIWYLVYGV